MSNDHPLPGDLAAFVRESPIIRSAILRSVEDFADSLPAGSRILDAGAGQSPYRTLFDHCEYLTQDWPASPHDRAAEADIVADLCALPIDDRSFDAALCTEVLEHVATPEAAARELFRILRPDGMLLVTVPFVGELHEEPNDHYRFTSYGIEGMLERAGFRVESVEPVSGYFRTVIHTLRNGGLAIRASDHRSRLATRAIALLLLAVSVLLIRVARNLDRLDEKGGLPLGWIAIGSVPRG